MEDQESADRFYWSHGACCAGCDWWQHVWAGHVGLCTKAAPVAAHQRVGLLEITGASIEISAGHPFTRREHHCGDFNDDFDWHSLPIAYLARIGAPSPPNTPKGAGDV